LNEKVILIMARRRENNTVGAESTGNRYSEKARELFELYPGTGVFYFTSDGMAFFSEADASNHARGLEDKRIIKELREDVTNNTDNV
jgi:IS1 family transposase